jgi:hypothetical protein
MKRREFITLIDAVAAWPGAVRAQPVNVEQPNPVSPRLEYVCTAQR